MELREAYDSPVFISWPMMPEGTLCASVTTDPYTDDGFYDWGSGTGAPAN